MKFSLACLLFLLPFTLLSQKEATNWYFCDKGGVSFASGSPVNIPNGKITGSNWEGNATISDRNTGALLFYTDGVTVYNKNHTMMQNGTGLGGAPSSSQSAIIVPDPGDCNRYFIFTVDADNGSHGLSYSEVDMLQNGGLGAVTVKNQQLISVAAEKLTAVRQANKKDYWVLAHEWGSNKYSAYPLTAAGVGSPVISAVGIPMTNLPVPNMIDKTRGCMKLSPDGKKLAVAFNVPVNVPNPSPNVDLLDFDIQTGVVSNSMPLTAMDLPYGVSFSPDNTKLYISSSGGTSADRLIQYDLTAANVNASKTAVRTAPPNTEFFGSLQIAPDGKIYSVRYQSGFLGVINNPNVVAPSCNYSHNGFSLGGKLGYLGLPDFVESFFAPFTSAAAPDLGKDTVLCTGSSIVLDAGVSGTTYLWSTGETTQTILVSTSGAYWVQLPPGPCSTIPFSDTISVSLPGLSPISLGNDVSFCPGSQVTLNAGALTGLSYVWSTGATTTSISISSAGTYWLEVQNSCGIKQSDTIEAGIIPPPVALVSGATICAGQAATLNASGGGTYIWNNGNTTNSISVSPVVTSTYSVIVSAGSCKDTASAAVVVAPVPVANTSGNMTIQSGSSTTLSASGGGTYLWYPSTGLSCDTCFDPVAAPDETTDYCVVVTNSSGCADTSCLKVTVDIHCEPLYIPNAFSPNGDLENDSECVFGTCIKLFHMVIYDRWGEPVFESNNQSRCWDGTYKGELLNSAVFTYRLEVTYVDDSQTFKKGNISLIR